MYRFHFKSKSFVLSILLIFSFISLFFIVLGDVSLSQSNYENLAPSELQKTIKQKSKELLELEKQAEEFRKKIKTTQAFSNTLKSEIKKLDWQEKSVSLSVSIVEKRLDILSLEIENLKEEVNKLSEKLSANKDTLASLLETLYEKEQISLLELALSKKDLSEMLNEFEAISSLQNSVAIKLREIKKEKEDLKRKIDNLESIRKKQLILQSDLEAKKTILANQKEQKKYLLKKTKNKESNYRTLLKVIEKRREEIAKEIDDLEEALRKKVNLADLPQAKVLSWPVNGPITQGYGATKFAKTHYHSRFHNGIDIGVPIGTPIKAAAPGIVIGAGNQDRYCYKGAYGKFVFIKHYNGLATLYAHLSLIKVKIGEEVKRGQIIGYSGVSGYSTGPHLHFGVYDAKTVSIKESKYCGPMPVGGSVNPLDYLR